jgi:cyclophilin family peptidyl-prolyl cis-trans isomerase
MLQKLLKFLSTYYIYTLNSKCKTMNKWGILSFIILLAAGISCGNAEEQQKDDLVLIKTPHGNIKIKLYNKTEEHKKNFEKLVSEGFYNGLLFHRVINEFMIQGGDPESRDAKPDQKLGGGSLDYTVPAEFIPEYYHKRGAVAAARRIGLTNDLKRSSASQFYIVQGQIFSESELDTIEMQKNQHIKNELVRADLMAAENEIQVFRDNNDREGFSLKVMEIRDRVDSLIAANNLRFQFTPEQRKVYSTIGGYPSLDGDYSVFGEVVEGMEVVDKIAAVETDKNNRPLKDVKMEIELLNKE